jgi:hypothetical protein
MNEDSEHESSGWDEKPADKSGWDEALTSPNN